MEKEIIEAIIHIADEKGFYKERNDETNRLMTALIDSSSLSYDKKHLSIDSDTFTALLKFFDNEGVQAKIEKEISNG